MLTNNDIRNEKNFLANHHGVKHILAFLHHLPGVAVSFWWTSEGSFILDQKRTIVELDDCAAKQCTLCVCRTCNLLCFSLDVDSYHHGRKRILAFLRRLIYDIPEDGKKNYILSEKRTAVHLDAYVAKRCTECMSHRILSCFALVIAAA